MMSHSKSEQKPGIKTIFFLQSYHIAGIIILIQEFLFTIPELFIYFTYSFQKTLRKCLECLALSYFLPH